MPVANLRLTASAPLTRQDSNDPVVEPKETQSSSSCGAVELEAKVGGKNKVQTVVVTNHKRRLKETSFIRHPKLVRNDSGLEDDEEVSPQCNGLSHGHSPVCPRSRGNYQSQGCQTDAPAKAKQRIQNGSVVGRKASSFTKKTTRGLRQASSSIKRKEKKHVSLEAKRERKAAKTLAIVTGAFIACWLPFFILALLMPIFSDWTFDPHLVSFFLWLGYFNSTLNPIIYTVFSPEFRQAFQRILCGKPNINHRPRHLQ